MKIIEALEWDTTVENNSDCRYGIHMSLHAIKAVLFEFRFMDENGRDKRINETNLEWKQRVKNLLGFRTDSFVHSVTQKHFSQR